MTRLLGCYRDSNPDTQVRIGELQWKLVESLWIREVFCSPFVVRQGVDWFLQFVQNTFSSLPEDLRLLLRVESEWLGEIEVLSQKC